MLASLEVERIEEQLKEAKKRREELAALVADEYQANETRSQSIEVDGKRFTVYRRRTLEASVPVVNRAAWSMLSASLAWTIWCKPTSTQRA